MIDDRGNGPGNHLERIHKDCSRILNTERTLGSEALPLYKRIIIALDESLAAKRALASAIELTKQLGSELRIITVSEPLPAYVGFMDSEVPGARQKLIEERNAFYGELQRKALEEATGAGVKVDGVVIEGDEVLAIVDHIVTCGADLLVIGRRHHTSIPRLWGGTVHNIAERVRCSILAVN